MCDIIYIIFIDDVCGVFKLLEVVQKGWCFFFVFQGKYFGNFYEIE